MPDRAYGELTSPDPPEHIRQLRAANQTALVEFLRTEVELSLGMLEKAQSVAREDPHRCFAILGRVRVTLNTVHQFLGRVQDPKAWEEVHSKTNELESVVAMVALQVRQPGVFDQTPPPLVPA